MNSSAGNWARPYYAPGGGDAFLFYVIYGPAPRQFSISGSEYHFEAIPDGMEISRYGPTSEPEVLNTFRFGDVWDEFQV